MADRARDGDEARGVITLHRRRQRGMTVKKASTPSGDDESTIPSIVWRNYAGTYLGVDRSNRVWGVAPTLLGWRLEVREVDNTTWTYLGMHPTRHNAVRRAEDVASEPTVLRTR
jgi:hypothetical protein